MNKEHKIDARYSVAQAMQRNWQGYLRSLSKQQFFGIVRKGHYLSIFKELSTRMVQQNAWVVLLLYLYLFICHTITIITKKCQKKNVGRNWRGGLKETIELMIIRPPQLQFFEDRIKITATDTK